ncbi:MAG: hypothetical protein E7218_05355, partial [Anaerofustis stercorihominis]|nr:hypothetical protein [Anaerofustis stercorihominis]
MKNKSILNSCLLLNIVQLFISVGAAVVKYFGLLDNLLVRTSLFALQIFVWIMFTMHIFVKNDYKKRAKGFVVGLVAVLPAVLLTVAGALAGHFSDPDASSWFLFSFLGSALSFYNKSAIILTNYVRIADAYLIFCINYAVMIVCATVGGMLGASSNISIDKKKA